MSAAERASLMTVLSQRISVTVEDGWRQNHSQRQRLRDDIDVLSRSPGVHMSVRSYQQHVIGWDFRCVDQHINPVCDAHTLIPEVGMRRSMDEQFFPARSLQQPFIWAAANERP